MVSQTIINNLISETDNVTMSTLHAAVVMYGGKPVSYGYNHFDVHNNSIHAEQHALFRFMRSRSDLFGFLDSRYEKQCILCV